ncbi:MAG: tyrosine-type recombinase/integrase [bacterium]
MPQVALTDRFAAAAKSPDGAQTDYFDAGTKGLALRVASGGRKSWTFIFTSPKDGKRARLTLGTYPATSLATARTLALEAKGHVEAGNDPRDVLASQEAAAVTVKAIVESYLAKHARPNLRTAAAIERRLNKNVVPVIGAVKIAEMHRRDVNRVVDPILARERPVEASRVFEDLRAVLRWAVKRGDLDFNPMEGMSKPRGSSPKERVLSDDEMRKLWTGLDTALPRRKACQWIIKLLLVTGQRVGEVAGMRRDELDLDARTWSLPGSRTKNGHPHLVPLSDLAVEIIEEALADADARQRKRLDDPDAVSIFVFPWGDGALTPHAVAQAVGRRAQLGMPAWTAHDLRRTALTQMGKLGIPPLVRGHVANHRTITKAGVTLGVYDQWSYEGEKREALDMWADRLQAIIAGQGAEVVPMRKGA